MNRFFILFVSILLISGCIQIPGQQPSGAAKPPSAQAPQNATPPAAQAQNQPPPAEAEPPPAVDLPPANQTQANASQPAQTTIKNKEISYKSGAWKIYGTLYESQSKTPTKAIILLPMLNETRESYPISFIESLHNQLPDSIVIAIDMRGHGKSTNLGTWEKFDTDAYREMKLDIINARTQYIEPNYPNVEKIYVVGASIGSTAAVLAGAQDPYVSKIAMLSPGMEYKGVDISRAVKDDYVHPLLAVATSGDSYSAQAVSQIKSLTPDPQTETRIYPGPAHGTDMFAATEGNPEPLSALIVEFLK